MLVEFAAYLMNRCAIGSDGKTPLQRLHGRKDNTPILEFGEKILYVPAKPARGGKSPRKGWRPRHAQRSSGQFPSRRGGTRTEYSECELFSGLWMAVTMHSTFKSEMERPPEMAPRSLGEVLMKNSENVPSQSRLRIMGSWVPELKNCQRSMSEKN